MTNFSGKKTLRSFSIILMSQLATIFVGLIRTKIVAIFWGPLGVGVIGILQTAIELLYSIITCGIATSAIREIAVIHIWEDKKYVIQVFKYLSAILGIIGLLIVLVSSPLLSLITFGDIGYTSSYVILSLYLFFRTISSYYLSVMQGNQLVQSFAISNTVGPLLSLLFIFPIVYYFDNIGPSLLLLVVSVSTLIASMYYYKRLKLNFNVDLSKSRFVENSKKILKLGISLTISGSVLTLLISFVTRTFISNMGSIEEVGFYQAGWTVINSYIGVFFVVMSTDYYPKLSSVILKPLEANLVFNQQIVIALLLLAPALILLLFFLKILVPILYTAEFDIVVVFVKYSLLGVFFKAIAYSISYIYLAKSAIKVYMLTEIISSLLILIFNFIGFKYWGITGMGIAYSLGYLASFVAILSYLNRVSSEIFIQRNTIVVISISLLLLSASLLVDICLDGAYKYVLLVIFFMTSVLFSLYKFGFGLKILQNNR